MSLTPNNMSYHDLGSLQQIRSTAGKDKEGALRQAAEQFESIFFSMLLGSMRKAGEAFEVEGMMNSQTTKFYRDMQDSQMATELSQSGALGLADLLVQQLSPALGIPTKSQSQSQPQTHTLPDAAEKQLAMPKVILPARLSSAEVSNTAQNVLNNTQHTVMPAIAEIATDVPQVDAKPKVDKAEWQVASPSEFVRQLLPAARQSAKALGLDPLALVAQAALETGWGKRMIKTGQGDHSFNLFGIKANNSWQGETAVVDTLEYRQGIAKKEQAKFRSYASPEHSLQDYVAFIKQNPRYQDAVNATADPKAYFEQLQAAGYATDPAYANKIMAVYQSPVLRQAVDELADAQEMAPSAE